MIRAPLTPFVLDQSSLKVRFFALYHATQVNYTIYRPREQNGGERFLQRYGPGESYRWPGSVALVLGEREDSNIIWPKSSVIDTARRFTRPSEVLSSTGNRYFASAHIYSSRHGQDSKV